MCRCAGLKVAVQACLVHDAMSELGGVQVPALVDRQIGAASTAAPGNEGLR